MQFLAPRRGPRNRLFSFYDDKVFARTLDLQEQEAQIPRGKVFAGATRRMIEAKHWSRHEKSF